MKTLPDDHDPNRLPPRLANASTADLRVVLEFFDCDALRRFYPGLISLLQLELRSRRGELVIGFCSAEQVAAALAVGLRACDLGPEEPSDEAREDVGVDPRQEELFR